MLHRIGASVTDYGVISARGRSLYEFVPYQESEVKELTEELAETDINEDMQMGGMKL